MNTTQIIFVDVVIFTLSTPVTTPVAMKHERVGVEAHRECMV